VNETDQYTLKHVLADFATATSTSRKYCFVLGSGASQPSGIPTGAKLVDRWLRELYQQDRAGSNHSMELVARWASPETLDIADFSFESRAAFYAALYARRFRHDAQLGQQCLSALIKNKTPSFGYSVLARILSYSPHSIVITTNFDHLIEESLRRYGAHHPRIVHHSKLLASPDVGFAQNLPHIFKVHGDIYFRTYNSVNDTTKLDVAWKRALRQVLAEYVPVVIGYGGNDPDLMSMLAQLDSHHIPAGPIWFFYKIPPVHPAVHRFMERQGGHFIQGPDFDQLMLLIGSAFGITSLERKAQALRANQQAAWMRDFEYLSEQVLGSQPARDVTSSSDDDEYKRLFRSAVSSFLDPSASSTWWDWHCSARVAGTVSEATAIYRKGISKLRDNLPLQAMYAGHLARKLGRIAEATTRSQDALRQAVEALGADHSDTIAIRHQYARVLEFHNTPESRNSAEEEFSRVWQDRVRVLGAHHPDTLASLFALGRFLASNGLASKAVLHFEELLAHRRLLHGDDHKLTAQARDALEALLRTPERVVMIHQPHFLPWLGYFNKFANASVFVSLDTVNYRERYFQNRTRIVDMHGHVAWLTIPASSSIHNPIANCRIVSDGWRELLVKQITHCYRRAPFFDMIMPSFKKAIEHASENLADMNLDLIRWAAMCMGLPDRQIIRASDCPQEADRTQRLISICKGLGATKMLVGEGGVLRCHNVGMLQHAGIKLVQQEFRRRHPRYRHWQSQFYEGLSVLDALMQAGPFDTREMVTRTWTS
jgi:hypothetical protein